MSIPVTYAVRHAWMSPATKGDNRPYDTITIYGDTGRSVDFWGLLDTGADFLMLESDIAEKLGINLSGCIYQPVRFGSGHQTFLPRRQIEVGLFGQRAEVDAVFGIGGTPLIGRTTILKFADFGIDMQGWLRT